MVKGGYSRFLTYAVFGTDGAGFRTPNSHNTPKGVIAERGGNMGRKAKPVDLQLVQGNPNRRTKKELHARKQAEEKLKPNSDRVKPPGWLGKQAKKEFRRIVKEMEHIDLLTNVDVDMLACYCDAYEGYQEATRIIQEEGMMVEYTNKAAETNKVPHPLLAKRRQLFDQMKSIAGELGLSPSSRAKLALPRDNDKPKDPFEERFGDRL